MLVEPVPERLNSLISISVSGLTSIVLPSKKSSTAFPSLPVCNQSPALSSMPAVAATHVAEPLFCTSTSPLRDEIVLGGALFPGVAVAAGVTVVVGVGLFAAC